MSLASKHVTVSGAEFGGAYEVVEELSDGSLVLRPERELLSAVLDETDGKVFTDEELIAHLKRVVATEDDLPPDSAV
jgi:hypothetical protein